ncbi:MAG: formimidoylglutamase [Bacteroidales bacterium]
MELSDFFLPLHDSLLYDDGLSRNRFGDAITAYFDGGPFPDPSEFRIALIGVTEDRNAVSNRGSSEGPDIIRKEFYKLFPGNFNPKIVDLGNLANGHQPEDTYFALTSVVSTLIDMDVLPVILGGSQDLTFAQYRAYEKLGQIVNLVAIDPRFDLGEVEGSLDNISYLSKIILHQPNFLFNFTNIGYQTYYVDQDAIQLMKNLLFDSYRVGLVRENLEEAEPLIRNADIISVDVTAIRMCDAPGSENASPNGFYGEEICQLMRYAGRSDKLTSIGFYEYNPAFDARHQTAQLVAQMIWYLLEGFCFRSDDLPAKGKPWDEHSFIKYIVPVENHDHEIVFLKSRKSDRWWMKVPCRSESPASYERHYFVPCSYNDYQIALKNDVPDRWWQVYQKLM